MTQLQSAGLVTTCSSTARVAVLLGFDDEPRMYRIPQYIIDGDERILLRRDPDYQVLIEAGIRFERVCAGKRTTNIYYLTLAEAFKLAQDLKSASDAADKYTFVRSLPLARTVADAISVASAVIAANQ